MSTQGKGVGFELETFIFMRYGSQLIELSIEDNKFIVSDGEKHLKKKKIIIKE
jgi:hypothetical protein